jgi:hypothetical protein
MKPDVEPDGAWTLARDRIMKSHHDRAQADRKHLAPAMRDTRDDIEIRTLGLPYPWKISPAGFDVVSPTTPLTVRRMLTSIIQRVSP